MTFLTTPYLWLGLAAAALPVIIHLIRRTKVQVVQFAAMRFLQATPQRMIRRQKLKQIILLALRILALLLLGLAFARPFFPDSAPVAILSKQQKSIAIVVDASASMLAGTKSDKLKEAAGEIINRAGGGTRFSIVTAGATPQIVLDDGDAGQARAALATIRPTHSAGDLREAVLAADNLLRLQAARRAAQSQLHVVSDLQLTNAPEGMITLSSDAESFASDDIPSWQNVAVIDGTIEDVPACRVKNFSNVEQMTDVTLYLGRFAYARQRVVLQRDEEKVVQFPEARDKLQSAGAGYFEVRAGIDDFAEDNRFYCSAAMASSASRRILAVTNNSATIFFARQAFSIAGAPFRVFEISPNQISDHPLADYECVLIFSGSGLNRNGAEVLRKFVEAGGGLLIAPSPSAGSQDVSAFNLMLSELMPAKLLPPLFTTVDRNRSRRLTDVEYLHPIFKLFAEPANGDPGSARFFQYFAVDAVLRSGAITLASFDDNHAALIETTVGKGKVLLWTAGLDAQWSDLPLKPIFLPLIHQMAGYLARPQLKRESLAIGQPIFLDGYNASQEMKVVLPDGAERELPARTSSFNETNQAGIYRFYQQGREASFAVNLDRRESDPQSLSPADFLARLSRGSEDAQVAGVFGSAEVSEVERERTQKFWRLALFVLLLLLIGEGWLAKRTPR
jgi:hypothetical protein